MAVANHKFEVKLLWFIVTKLVNYNNLLLVLFNNSGLGMPLKPNAKS